MNFYAALFLMAASAVAQTKQTYTIEQLIAMTGQLQEALKSGDQAAARRLAPNISLGVGELFRPELKSTQDRTRDLEAMIAKYPRPMGAPLKATLAER
ncbi:MAG: hypothetical protein ABIR70_19540 [Bryobacteraceae bacterium]